MHFVKQTQEWKTTLAHIIARPVQTN